MDSRRRNDSRESLNATIRAVDNIYEPLEKPWNCYCKCLEYDVMKDNLNLAECNLLKIFYKTS